ncbi:MAG: MFS transporter [Candidatus Eremiobacterota bacterium]
MVPGSRRLGPEASPKEKKRAYLALFLTVFTSLIGFGIVIPLLPSYGKAAGGSPWLIGWLFASYSLAQLVAAPVLGELSDRFGRRPVILGSLIGTAVSFVMMALAQDLTMLFAARILDGLSGGNISTARAYVADITHEQNRAKTYGALIGVAFGLGFVMGPALGGLLFRIDLSAPAWLAAALSLAATFIALVWLPETVHSSTAKRPPVLASLPVVLAQPAMAFLLLVDYLVWSSLSVYQTTFPLFAEKRFHWTPDQIGLVLAGVGLLGAFTQGGMVAPLVRRLGERKVLTLGIAVSSLGLLAVARAHTPTALLVALIPAVLGSSLVSPTLLTLISLASREDEQGRVQGVATAMEGLARATGPVWGNGLLHLQGEGVAYSSAALVLLVTAALSLAIRPAGRESAASA